jgi:formamidopyrimidine-DNA glycosylase
MPELPEVQTVVNDLNAAGLAGATITAAHIFWPRIVATPASPKFCAQIKGQTIQTIWRRAKYLVFDLTNDQYLLIHLRMSGRLQMVAADVERAKHEHAILDVQKPDQEEGRWQLRFHDTRKFGRLYLVEDLARVLGKLGPEPLEREFTEKFLAENLRARRRQLKPLLLDQTFVAGLGNIYVDEALWDARLHPCRLADTVTEPEAHALHRAIRKVLRRGIANFGTTLGSGQANFYSIGRRTGNNREQLQVFRRTASPCPRCQTLVERIIVGQRSTHICPRCQQL